MERDPRDVFSWLAVSSGEEFKDVEADRNIARTTAKVFLAACCENGGPRSSQVISGLQSLVYLRPWKPRHMEMCPFPEAPLGVWAQSWRDSRRGNVKQHWAHWRSKGSQECVQSPCSATVVRRSHALCWLL